MPRTLSNILPSSLIKFAFQFKRYCTCCKLAQVMQNAYKIKLSNIAKSYSKQVSIKLEAYSKHTEYVAKGNLNKLCTTVWKTQGKIIFYYNRNSIFLFLTQQPVENSCKQTDFFNQLMKLIAGCSQNHCITDQTWASELMKSKFCSRPNLEVLTENAKHLEKVISDTNELAEKVSSKVRILDLAKVTFWFS